MIGQAGLFIASLAVTLGASELMARGLSSLGHRLRLSEGLVGLLVALGADAPELSSAVFALAAGSRQVGVGVVLGSNLFNLAALLGLAALLSRRLAMSRDAILLDGGAGVAALLLSGLVLAGVAPTAAAVLLLLLVAAYAAALAAKRDAQASIPAEAFPAPAWWPVAALPLAVAAVVAGSFGLVHSALELARAWHVPQPVTGGLFLAILTSIPNAYAAVHLGRRGRGTAVLSEAMNSNTLNLLVGLVIPVAFFGVTVSAGSDYIWLLGLTAVALAWCAVRRGMDRRGGLVLIAGYAGFVVFLLARG